MKEKCIVTSIFIILISNYGFSHIIEKKPITTTRIDKEPIISRGKKKTDARNLVLGRNKLYVQIKESNSSL